MRMIRRRTHAHRIHIGTSSGRQLTQERVLASLHDSSLIIFDMVVAKEVAQPVHYQVVQLAVVAVAVLFGLLLRALLADGDGADKNFTVLAYIIGKIGLVNCLAAYSVQRGERKYIRNGVLFGY